MSTVLITGGGSLIGEAIGQCLNEAGWHVVLTDIDTAKAELAASTLAMPARSEIARMDVTDRVQVEAVVAGVIARHGRLDALVNVAGGGRGVGIPKRDFVDYSPQEVDRLLTLNLTGVFNSCRSVLPHMIASGGGNIVSITAARGLRGGPQASIYSAAKAAIIVFTQSLSQEVGQHGIRVNTVAPGNTAARWKTDMSETRSPLGTPTSPTDVGNAVAFLLSDKASHITGSCLDVSGGTALH
jgi:NAD(P)-dependent dehydrogenase (short-subunit alcohol dehydrogenase family)